MVNWEDRLKKLLRRGKVTTAAVLDLEGEMLAAVPELSFSLQQGKGLVRAATANYAGSFKLQVAGTCFTCYMKDRSTLLGCAEGTVLVSRRTHDVLLVGLADSHSPGSCLYEVTEFANTLDFNSKKRKASTRKMAQSGA